MINRIVKNVSQKILIIGPAYNKFEKLLKIRELIQDYAYIIINGGLYYRFDDLKEFKRRIEFVSDLLQTHKVIYNMCGEDLLLIEGLLVDIPKNIVDWYIDTQGKYRHPYITTINFVNSNKLTIMAGGITPKMTQNKKYEISEVAFVDKINGQSWHDLYNGSLGYIISNNPLSEEDPKFYRYSAQIGNKPETNILYAQEADQFGLKRTILL